MDEVLGLFDNVIQKWFRTKFRNLAPPQKYAVPLIHDRSNVLITSPTGSGKTLTAFISVINELLLLGKKQQLEDRIYCVYVSPLKALANDIERNLKEPLAEISALASEMGIELPEIRVAVRSGDTPTSERQKMTRKPPHIFITTPETLGIVLSTKRFKEHMNQIRYMIVDEIHELCNSKRGVMLSLCMERLEHQNRENPTPIARVGLSATQAPIREIAKFLVGYRDNGKLRDVYIVNVESQKALDVAVKTPSKDLNFTPYEIVNNNMYQMLKEYIDTHRTTLIFTNTRSGTEAVVYRLQELGLENIGAHHGSLSREHRLEVERQLKNGELKAVTSSTSLELGIDIGYIDVVMQIGSPKSIAKGIQRVGRAGLRLHEVSKGRFLAFDRDDLIESAVLINCANRGKIDRTHILKNSLDVLAQMIVGMSLEQKWDVNEAYVLIKRSYNYRKLRKRDFVSILEFLGQRGKMENWGVYRKIWYSPEDKTFGIKKGSRQIYNLNIGTIPQESSYKVVMYKTNMAVGSLSEKFVERLKSGDIFVLGGRSYEFTRARGTRVYVKDAHGRRPTVPSWTGEMLPRSFDLSVEVGKFRGKVEERYDEGQKARNILNWIRDGYHVDESGAVSILNYIKEQSEFTRALTGRSQVPSDRRCVLEGHLDNKGNYNIIFHYCFGRRVNDALSRAYAYKIMKNYDCNVAVTLSDDNFMLTTEKEIPLDKVAGVLGPDELEESLKASIRSTELFKQRFRHCAVRSLMILRNYKGREISVRKQHRRVQKIIDDFLKDESFPVVQEAYNEILHDAMDLTNAGKVLKDIKNGKIGVEYIDYNGTPSPMAHNIVLMGFTDLILMEDRTAMMKSLHMKVLEHLMEEEGIEFTSTKVDNFFSNKRGRVAKKNDVLSYIKKKTGIHLFKTTTPTIHAATRKEPETVEKWCRGLIDNGKITSVYKGGGSLYIDADDLETFYTLYADKGPLSDEEKLMLEKIEQGDGSIDKGDPRDVVRHLERKYRIYRMYPRKGKAGINYGTRGEIEEVDRGEAERELLIRVLGYTGPCSEEELCYHMSYEAEEIRRVIDLLMGEGVIREGDFVFDKERPQYMLEEDYHALKSHLGVDPASQVEPEEAEESLYDNDSINKLRQKVLLAPVKEIENYVDRYLCIVSPRSLYLRNEDFDIGDMYELLEEERLIQGRFLSGIVCYVTPELARIFAKMNMRDVFDSETIFKVYESLVQRYREVMGTNDVNHVLYSPTPPGLNVGQISTALGLDTSEVREVIKILERANFVVRHGPTAVQMRKGQSNMNLYVPYVDKEVPSPEFIFESVENRFMNGMRKPLKTVDIIEPQERKKAANEVVIKLLKGMGPMTSNDILYYLGLRGTLGKDLMEDIEKNPEIERIKVRLDTGGRADYLVHRDHLKTLEKTKGKSAAENRDDIISLGNPEMFPLYDPYCYHLRGEISMAVGEGWFSPLILDGRPVGYVELWPMGGVVDIRNLVLFTDREKLLPQVLGEVLPRWLDYYRQLNLTVLRLRSVDGKGLDETDMEIKELLEENGYARCPQGFYSYGGVKSEFLDEDELFSIAMYFQRIHPSKKYVTAMEAIKSMGGVRSEFPLAIRVKAKVYDLDELAKHFRLVGGKLIPSYFMYTTRKNMERYKRAKGAKLDERSHYVLECLPDDKPISVSSLKNKVPISDKEFNKIKNHLYNGLFIAKTSSNMYVKISENDEGDRREARKTIVMDVFKNFGVVRAEDVSRLLGGEISMYEIRSILGELVDEGEIIKGFFNIDTDDLYFAHKDAFSQPVSKIDGGIWVLTHDDPFWHYLSPSIRSRFNIGTCNVIMDGLDMEAAFKGHVKSIAGGKGRGKHRAMEVHQFVGDEKMKKIVDQFTRMHQLVLRWAEGEEEQRDEDEAIYGDIFQDQVYEEYE